MSLHPLLRPQVEDSADPDGAMGPFSELAAAVSSMYNGAPLMGPLLFAIHHALRTLPLLVAYACMLQLATNP